MNADSKNNDNGARRSLDLDTAAELEGCREAGFSDRESKRLVDLLATVRVWSVDPRELDHLEETLELKMQNLQQRQETAYERFLREIETMRADHEAAVSQQREVAAEMKADNSRLRTWIARWLIIAVGLIATLVGLSEFVFT